jgi:hypothetical protein
MRDAGRGNATADWGQYGAPAGPIRNKTMLTQGRPDVVLAFPGGTGTADMKRQARRAGVRVVEVTGDFQWEFETCRT